jgi:hypothetical protein
LDRHCQDQGKQESEERTHAEKPPKIITERMWLPKESGASRFVGRKIRVLSDFLNRKNGPDPEAG